MLGPRRLLLPVAFLLAASATAATNSPATAAPATAGTKTPRGTRPPKGSAAPGGTKVLKKHGKKAKPSLAPSQKPSAMPSLVPSAVPSAVPTTSTAPSRPPSPSPTNGTVGILSAGEVPLPAETTASGRFHLAVVPATSDAASFTSSERGDLMETVADVTNELMAEELPAGVEGESEVQDYQVDCPKKYKLGKTCFVLEVQVTVRRDSERRHLVESPSPFLANEDGQRYQTPTVSSPSAVSAHQDIVDDEQSRSQEPERTALPKPHHRQPDEPFHQDTVNEEQKRTVFEKPPHKQPKDQKDPVDADALVFPEPSVTPPPALVSERRMEDYLQNALTRIRDTAAVAYASDEDIAVATVVPEQDLLGTSGGRLAPDRERSQHDAAPSGTASTAESETEALAAYMQRTAFFALVCFGGVLVVFGVVLRRLSTPRTSRHARVREEAHAFDDELSSLGNTYDKTLDGTECTSPGSPPPRSPRTSMESAFIDELNSLNAVVIDFDEMTGFEVVRSPTMHEAEEVEAGAPGATTAGVVANEYLSRRAKLSPQAARVVFSID